MIEIHGGPKSLYDLVKAIGRWEIEGGAKEAAQESEKELALQAFEERILRCLGAAVIFQWNDLPTPFSSKPMPSPITRAAVSRIAIGDLC